ncbi:hypothetical protein H0A36_15050 [Endozoicomonas sp. SM1973]|uniref:Uncharacterized protein n=1 Tax=Spartinivicinus marinus TaxID=2994442 RepID=A0A853I1Q1_9GAMM|nr:hypothetical protein [Spartinivicinus marinus]MCX4026252.1 hypothetical protein [Spartinivicinus marinus]NYZ67333.1 hypothetical protein [Spartinivicinus marinus]
MLYEQAVSYDLKKYQGCTILGYDFRGSLGEQVDGSLKKETKDHKALLSMVLSKQYPHVLELRRILVQGMTNLFISGKFKPMMEKYGLIAH